LRRAPQSKSPRLTRPGFLNVEQAWADPFPDILDRLEKHEVEDHDRERGNGGGRPVMRAHACDAWGEGDDAEEAEQDNDGIKAGALPVAATEMQPHPEFIEGERHAEPVEERAELAHAIARPRGKDEQPANRGEKKDSVVEMMNMGPAEVQKQIGNAPRHDENYQKARRDEGEKKSGKRDPRQTTNRKSRSGGRGVRHRWPAPRDRGAQDSTMVARPSNARMPTVRATGGCPDPPGGSQLLCKQALAR